MSKFGEMRDELVKSVDNLRYTKIPSRDIVDMMLVAYIDYLKKEEKELSKCNG